MSESFSDLPGLSFSASENPWENFQQLAARYPSFRLISPTVGGNTSLVEFELLTGLTNALLPTGAIPYDHYVRHPVPSLASILRGRGYRTIALHPFYPWFWSRNVAYENLGFEHFLSLDDFEGAELRGHFISDKSLVDKIIEVIETEDAPLLIHAVSMQNHMPYDYERYTEDTLLVEADLPDRLRQALSTYLTGVRDADRQLGRLLQYLDGRPEPTICLFFGDHQSVLEAELAPYRSEETPGGIAAHYRMAEVPGLLWANKPGLLDTDDIPESLSPCHLPAILLHQMGIGLPGHLVHMLRGVQIYPVIHREFVRDGSGALINLKLLYSDPWIQSLEALQYNLLFDTGH